MAVSVFSEVGPVTAVQPTPAFISPAPVVSERSFDDFMKGMLKTAHAADERQKAQEKSSGRQASFSPVENRKKNESADRRSTVSEPRRERVEAKKQEPRADVSEKTERPARDPKSESAPPNEATAKASDIEADVPPEQTGWAVVEAGEGTEVVGEAIVSEVSPESAEGAPVRPDSMVQPARVSSEAADAVSVADVEGNATGSEEIEAPVDWEPPLSHESVKAETEGGAPLSSTDLSVTDGQTQPSAINTPVPTAVPGEAIPASEGETDEAVWTTARAQALESEAAAASTPANPGSPLNEAPRDEAGLGTDVSPESAGQAERPVVESGKEQPRDQDTVTLSAEATRPSQKIDAEETTEAKATEAKPAEGDRSAIRTSEKMPDAPPVRPATQPVAHPASPVVGARQPADSEFVSESVSVAGTPGVSEPVPVSPRRGASTLSKADEAVEADDGAEGEGEQPVRMTMGAETQTERDAADDRSMIGSDGWAKGTAGAATATSRQTTSTTAFTDRFQGAQDMAAPSATPTAGAPATASASLSHQLEKVERLQELVEQFDRHILSLAGDKDKTLSITLEPKTLGKVVLNCRETGDRMAVEIVAENAGVRQLLQQQESSVRQLLEEHGYKMGAFDVRTQDRGGESSSFARRRERNDENAETGGKVKWRGEVTGSPEAGAAPSHAPRAAGGIWVVA